MDACDSLNDQTAESYRQRIAAWYHDPLFKLRNWGYLLTTVPLVRWKLNRLGLLQDKDSLHILDAGCHGLHKLPSNLGMVGRGRVMTEYTGADVYLPENMQICNDSSIELHLIESAIEDLPNDIGPFDAIFLNAVTHHIPTERLTPVFQKIHDLLTDMYYPQTFRTP